MVYPQDTNGAIKLKQQFSSTNYQVKILSEHNILTLYNSGNFLKVVRAIVDSPKTAKEIASATSMQEVTIATILEGLQGQNAVEYVDAKWKLTEKGKEVLIKFY